jgi:DUF917 family protein
VIPIWKLSCLNALVWPQYIEVGRTYLVMLKNQHLTVESDSKPYTIPCALLLKYRRIFIITTDNSNYGDLIMSGSR